MSTRTDEIERDLEDTRQRLGANIEELQHKLSPGQLVDQMINQFKGSGGSGGGGNDAFEALGRRVRDNPVPLALIGVGAAWLLAGGGPTSGTIAEGSRDAAYRSRRLAEDTRYRTRRAAENTGDSMRRYTEEMRSRGDRDEVVIAAAAYDPYLADPFPDLDDEFYPGYEDDLRMVEEQLLLEDLAMQAELAAAQLEREEHEEEGAFRDRKEEARARVLGMQRQAQESGEAFKARVDEGMRNARLRFEDGKRRADDMRRNAAFRSRAARDRAMTRGRELGRNAGNFMQENPLAVGVMGISLGAMIGMLLPRTQYEDEHIGPYRDRVRGHAEGHAQDAMQRARRVGEDVMEQGRAAAEREGFPTGRVPRNAGEARAQTHEAAERARRVVEETAEAGRQSAERESGVAGQRG